MFSQMFQVHLDFCSERSIVLFSTSEIKHGYIVLLQILPLFYNLKDWKWCFVYINWCKHFVYLEELESFNILINPIAINVLYGYVCRLTQSPVQCSLHDLRKPGAFLALNPDSLCDRPPIFLPPEWVVSFAAISWIIMQCFFPSTPLPWWETLRDHPKELHKRLLEGRSMGQA